MYIYTNHADMTRKTISITKPNDDWIKTQIAKEEYTSNSELINDLIRKARLEEEQLKYVRSRLDQAEKSGFSTMTPEDIRLKVKGDLKLNEKI